MADDFINFFADPAVQAGGVPASYAVPAPTAAVQSAAAPANYAVQAPSGNAENDAFNDSMRIAHAQQAAYYQDYIQNLAASGVPPTQEQIDYLRAGGYSPLPTVQKGMTVPTPGARPYSVAPDPSLDPANHPAIYPGGVVPPPAAAASNTINTVGGVPLAYNVPITQPLPSGVSEPELKPAGGQYGTSYYEAKTNNGLFAGAVMASPDQQIRLVDPNTGDVIYQGTGPEAARIATATANSISQGDGKKAAWQIQGNYGDQGWVTQAEDLKDTNHNFLGKLLDIALPILGAIFLPGIGAAIGIGGLTGASGAATALGSGVGAAVGSTTSGVIQGKPIGDIALGAGLAGLGAGVVGPALGHVVSGIGGSGGTLIGNAAGDTLGTTATELAPLTVTAAGSALPAAAGAGFGGVGAGALSSGGGGGNTVQPSTDIAGLTVSPAPTPSTVPAAAGAGAGGALAPPTDVAGVDVVAQPPPNHNPVVPLDQLVTPIDTTGLQPTNLPNLDQSNNVPASLAAVMATGSATQIASWIKAHPIEAAALGLTVAGLVGAGGSGNYGIPSGAGGAGTRDSLNPIFGATLPTGGILGTRTPRTQTLPVADWKRYAIENPEQSFFSNVPQGGAGKFSVPSPAALRAMGIGDLNADGVIDAADLALFRRKFGAQGFAKGGFAVADPEDMTDNYNTPLSPAQEKRFKVWQKANPRLGNTYDYDARGFWLHGAPTASNGHGDDRWKKPNHPTFSDQSDYTAPPTPGGHWDGADYTVNPDNPRAPSKEDRDAYWKRAQEPGQLIEKAKGGRTNFAVDGPGDGREDKIPAKLSDGEYVIDAETVAMLGNGSSKAGARKLDSFRVNIRKHKGKSLARGRFSAAAKDPRAYLSGGVV